MYEYLLFIDTETSDMPKRWNAPTAKVEEWPYILQIAWIVCKRSGELVCSRDFFVKHKNIEIDPSSAKLHGITMEMLAEKGIERKLVLNNLASDLEIYKPLIVGHFLEFDKKMMEVGYTREHIEQNFEHLPKFCTMLFTRKSKDIFGGHSYLRLNQLYELLFHKPIGKIHNALVDAEATKACFFELVKRGEITDKIVAKQIRMTRRRWELPIWMVILLATLLALLVVMAGLYLIF